LEGRAPRLGDRWTGSRSLGDLPLGFPSCRQRDAKGALPALGLSLRLLRRWAISAD